MSAPPTLRDRTSGVLLHVTSLPGPHGSGDLGPNAHGFVDLLAAGGQRWWQVLPINPPGGGASPYQTTSVFAGHPGLIALEPLVQHGWLSLSPAPGDEAHVRFDVVTAYRDRMLRHAHAKFLHSATPQERRELEEFEGREKGWLEDFALFSALKERNGGRSWTEWRPALVRREPHAMKKARGELAAEVAFQSFCQWLFDVQWRELRAKAHARGIGLLGDVPIFVAHDSADVWAHQELFFLDDDGAPTVVAGVPPDYFSETGQRWGNALYRWDVMRKAHFDWWRARMRTSLARFDAVRLDHFIGFVRYWEIPAANEDARVGVFRPGPGRALFDAIRKELGDVQLIAEDLGVITDEVKALRDGLDIPGMRVLQFAFGADPGSRLFQPHAFPRRAVVYTATHDNDTTVGWLRDPITKTDAGARAQRELMLRYAASDGREPNWDLIRLALSSVADTAIIPMQDVLGLGSEARMNTPATSDGNWSWRLRLAAIPHGAIERLGKLADLYDRISAAHSVASSAP